MLNALLLVAAISLNGSWDFRFEEGKSYREVADPAFVATDVIPVPSCYDMLPKWLCKRGTGLYRRTFSLDKAVEDAGKECNGDTPHQMPEKQRGLSRFGFAQRFCRAGALIRS